jgi:alkylhydroperoxidase/carboxymuconolactone decarboxylase family protein YurZ
MSAVVPSDSSSAPSFSGLSSQQLALCCVAAAAAVRSPNALWQAVEEAVAAGVSFEAVEEAVMAAVRMAAEATQRDTAPTLGELRARWGARQRWNLDQP